MHPSNYSLQMLNDSKLSVGLALHDAFTKVQQTAPGSIPDTNIYLSACSEIISCARIGSDDGKRRKQCQKLMAPLNFSLQGRPQHSTRLAWHVEVVRWKTKAYSDVRHE